MNTNNKNDNTINQDEKLTIKTNTQIKQRSIFKNDDTLKAFMPALDSQPKSFAQLQSIWKERLPNAGNNIPIMFL